MQGFLIFALGGGREGGEAGELATGDETKHEFDDDENGNDDTNDYQDDFHATLLLVLYRAVAVLYPSTPWEGRARRL